MNDINWRRVAIIYSVGSLIAVGLQLYGETYVLASSAAVGSGIVVPETEHDFGRVAPGTILKHHFVIENAGPKRIVLNRRDCCGEDSEHIIVRPGEESVIPLVLHAIGHAGEIQEVKTFSTSDPLFARIRFTVRVTVEP